MEHILVLRIWTNLTYVTSTQKLLYFGTDVVYTNSLGRGNYFNPSRGYPPHCLHVTQMVMKIFEKI